MKNILSKIRKTYSITQGQLAEQLQVSQALVSSVERGHSPMSIKLATKIKLYINLDPKDLKALETFIQKNA